MTLNKQITQYLQKHGATKVAYADITDVTIMEGRNTGIIYYITYTPQTIQTMKNAPSKEYAEALQKMNNKLDQIAIKCEQHLQNMGYKAHAQTRKRLGTDFGENNQFPLPHKTIATKAGLGWIGKSALLVTSQHGTALRLTSILTNAPLKTNTPITQSQCGKCNQCQQACPANAIKGPNWNTKTTRKQIYDDKKCKKYAQQIAQQKLNKKEIICGKCIYACPHTQKYMKKGIKD